MSNNESCRGRTLRFRPASCQRTLRLVFRMVYSIAWRPCCVAVVFVALSLVLTPSGRTGKSSAVGQSVTQAAPADSPVANGNLPSRSTDDPNDHKTVPPRDATAINAGIQRGIRFLLKTQNPDGSWGSADNTTGNDVYAPVPSAHQAFRAAVTSLCISALIEVGTDSPEVPPALDRAEA